jgi:hypothetical protein
VGSTFFVSASATLAGYSAASFGSAERAGFSAALDTMLDVASAAVQVTGVTDAAGRRRRVLLQAGAVSIAFKVTTSSASGASSLTSSLAAVSPAAFVVALQQNGLTALTGVMAISPPVLAVQTGAGPPPTVGAILASQANTSFVSPSQQLILTAAVTSVVADTSLLRLQWSVVSGPPLRLAADMAPTSRVLALPGGTLEPGGAYVFQLLAIDGNGQASARIAVNVTSLPVGGVLTVSPLNGTQLSTPFTLSTSGWSDANPGGAGLPLTYLFQYTVAGAAGEPNLLSEYSAVASLADVLFPVGTVQVQVLACNALGGVSAAPATLNVSVVQRVFSSAAAQSTFVQQLTTTAANLTSSAAVALVTGAAAMLNDAGSALNGNATAAAAVRTTLIATVAAAAANTSSPTVLQSAATAVSLLVANTAQVSGEGAASALSVLQYVSAAGSSRNVSVSLETSAAVTAGLSSIAFAVLAPNSTVGTGVLAQVSNIVDALATSQLSALTVPGAPPVEVSSAAIQMRVSLDSAGADSRLFTQPLSAPGSPSTFAPMPADIFGGAAAPVRTQFVSLAFDPFQPNAANSTGVTRLAFTATSGAEVPVVGLRVPIYFTLPRVPGLVDGLKAQCQWYDTTAQQYSTVGCVGIPNPVPPGHTFSWAANFSVTHDADMAAAWRVAGPLFNAANCSLTVLDCSDENSTVVIFPNPARPFDYPGVACNANISTAPCW